jgi:mono/diheme cytochrome c family protein
MMAMFISSDFWQPDRDQWKSLLTAVAMGLALINLGLMRIIWTHAFGWKEITYRRLSLVHRTFGYTAISIMLFIAIITCIGIVGYGGYATRPTWHSWLGITVLSLIGIKIFAVRKGLPEGARFKHRAILLAALGTVITAIMAATVLDGPSAFVMPMFPLVALIGLAMWNRFGYLPVVGTTLALSITLLFVSSGGWWYVTTATRGPAPDVSSVLALNGLKDMGRPLWLEKGCGSCHGDKGFGGVGPSLRRQEFFYSFTDEKIAQQVRAGKGIMPSFSQERISDQELAHIVAYVRQWYQ